MSKPKTLAEQLLLASNILWWMGTLMTGGLTYLVSSSVIDNQVIAFVAAGIGASAIQYVLSLMETALWDGSMPPPWRIKWTEGGPVVFNMATALTCLMLDMVLNLGGVGFVMSKMAQTNIGQQQFGMSPVFVSFLIGAFTILFSLLISVGPEQLRQRALMLQGIEAPRPMPRQEPRRPEPRHVEERRPMEQTRIVNQEEKQRIGRVINSEDLRV